MGGEEMNLSTFKNDIIPGWLIVKAARYAIDHPPRVNLFDRVIWVLIFAGLGLLTYQTLVWVLRG
jgi:hypothetical protein